MHAAAWQRGELLLLLCLVLLNGRSGRSQILGGCSRGTAALEQQIYGLVFIVASLAKREADISLLELPPIQQDPLHSHVQLPLMIVRLFEGFLCLPLGVGLGQGSAQGEALRAQQLRCTGTSPLLDLCISRGAADRDGHELLGGLRGCRRIAAPRDADAATCQALELLNCCPCFANEAADELRWQKQLADISAAGAMQVRLLESEARRASTPNSNQKV
eukprot:CAMPEP_0203969010 /NCGR_PEP_ID=MMETSP0359-20131031/97241_1 /ASSEMBLY_ACC=CAM_ASM_000338 /TAXON_ID=268821 /ORGANISM="Scrippsiella Hangoei, Strain SHTV-5" /LENGTH=217 /DNA_ID=CAMNT_0050906945 /DNA_START=712 /DNA_END=1366 /DNA_ORIENTATION=-